MTWQQKDSKAGLSNRMKVVLLAMVLIILLPVTVISLPLSKIVVEVTNTDDTLLVHVTVYVYGGDYHSFAFTLLPGKMESVSCPVTAGTHDIRIDYDYPEDPYYYGNMMWSSYSVGLFETHHAEFYLYPSSYSY